MRPDHNLVARLALALTIVVAGCNVAAAAELAIPPRLVPKNTSKDISIRTGPPHCSRWTDSCVNCTREEKDQPPVCSNIGFACQPKAIRCLSAR